MKITCLAFWIGINIVLPVIVLPSKLEILNVTHENIVNGKENYPLYLVCLVKRGKPPEVLRWKKNGILISQGGPSKLIFSLSPNKSDHQSVYTCEAHNTDMEKPLTKSIHLNIKSSRNDSKRTTILTASIVTTVILILLLVPVLLKCVFIVKDNIRNESVEEETEVIEGQSESVENRLYHSVQDHGMSVSQTHQDELVDDSSLTDRSNVD